MNLNDFNRRVLADFMKSVKEKYKKNKCVLKPEKVSLLQEKMKEKISKDDSEKIQRLICVYFDKCKNPEVLGEPKVSNSLQKMEKALDIPKELQNKAEEDDQDDLVQFYKKKEELRSFDKEESVSQNQIEGNCSSQELSADRNNQRQNLGEKVGMHIIGEFITADKKHNRKKGQKTISVDNAFVKIRNPSEELWLPNAKLIISTQEYSVQ